MANLQLPAPRRPARASSRRRIHLPSASLHLPGARKWIRRRGSFPGGSDTQFFDANVYPHRFPALPGPASALPTGCSTPLFIRRVCIQGHILAPISRRFPLRRWKIALPRQFLVYSRCWDQIFSSWTGKEGELDTPFSAFLVYWRHDANEHRPGRGSAGPRHAVDRQADQEGGGGGGAADAAAAPRAAGGAGPARPAPLGGGGDGRKGGDLCRSSLTPRSGWTTSAAC